MQTRSTRLSTMNPGCSVFRVSLPTCARFSRNFRTIRTLNSRSTWYKRPLWRGVFISSLWFLFVLAVNLPLVWPALRIYFHELTISQDVGHLMEALAANSKAHGGNVLSFAISLVQALLRPLLGIAFVLLYIDATAAADSNNRRD